MFSHWEHTEIVDSETYTKFSHHNIPVTPAVNNLPYNVAVYVMSEDGDRPLEGIYDPTMRGIRQIKAKAPNRDLRLYQDALDNEHITMLAVDGLTGCGKTSTAVQHMVNQHLKNVRVGERNSLSMPDHATPSDHQIILAKPHVNSGDEEYGFLPGDINEKITPTIQNFSQYFDRYHISGFERLREAGYVRILPLGFVRGLDADNITIIADECQNTKELISLATRKAKDCRILFLGDTSPFQIDRKGNTPTNNGLHKLKDLLAGAPYFQYIDMKTMQHVLRSDEVRDIMRRLMKQNGENPQEWIV